MTRYTCAMARDRFRANLLADLHAHGLSKWSPDLAFRNPCLYYQRQLRRVEFLQACQGRIARLLRALARFRLQRLSVRTGISIPPGVFDEGLSIAHYGSIVVNNNARVGKGCRIHSATNIGTRGDGAPVIGRYVYIGPGAIIYGPVKIGDYAVIGANSVVGRDIPDGVTVVGAPARVVSEKGSGSIMPAWYDRFADFNRER